MVLVWQILKVNQWGEGVHRCLQGVILSARTGKGSEKKLHTWIFHMLEQPIHSRLCIAITRREQRLLTTNEGKTHHLQLFKRCFVEGGCGCAGTVFAEFHFTRLQSFCEKSVQNEGIVLGKLNGDVCRYVHQVKKMLTICYIPNLPSFVGTQSTS